ncbi:MAG: tRNA (adenosine(37)-N6)-dimethylallyltransferase MiaA [Melioribacteraceae bacterium]|nr:tRNA (adenosine(37)-N6)-dimethylallyltransferase MiaA [Melioribacteraceae bacterium]
MSKNLIVILGPTAVGKTRLASKIASRYNGEIISADSRQIYKGMDIGTGKDLDDYTIEGKQIPYHLIDKLDPKTDEFNLFRFNELFVHAFNDIKEKEKTAILAGGTGLYIHSLLKKYELSYADFSEKRIAQLNKLKIEELQEKLKRVNPNLHNTTDLLNKERVINAIIIAEDEQNKVLLNRPDIDAVVIGVKLDREIIKERITKRLKARLENGMIEEAKRLLHEGVSYEKMMFFGLEYKFLGMYLKGELNYNDMFQKLNSSIHKFAKRQMTWFRKMEKEGVEINWIEGPDFETAQKIIDRDFLS